MSRGDTIRQKIERNLQWIFRRSEGMANLFSKDNKVFYKIEGICHNPILHGLAPSTVRFNTEIALLQELISKYSYNNYYEKILTDYCNRVITTENMIRVKYKIS